MTTKKKPVNESIKKTAEKRNISQYHINDSVVVKVGQGRSCIGRVMSLDSPSGYVKVRLGGSTHYPYIPEDIRLLTPDNDLTPGTTIMYKRDELKYTIKRAFRMDNSTFAMVEEVPYHISLEGWRILRYDVEQLTDGERVQYEAFRGITENLIAQCAAQGLVELVTIHALPLDVQLRTATESILCAYGGLMCRLASIRNIAG